MLLIDGQSRVVPAGGNVDGVRVLAVHDASVDVEIGGKRQRLVVGEKPIHQSPKGNRAGGQSIVLPVGPGGHFTAQGAVNGKPMTFLVDTGATSVSMGYVQAVYAGIDMSQAKNGMASTANGTIAVKSVMLKSVRVNDVEIFNVEALIVPHAMEHALLGNSFLSRFSMVRHSDVMHLTKR